jgi:AraC-like DNA-binding protein
MMRVDYQEYPVPEALRRHVDCVWRLTDEHPRAGVQTIYPDGRCELIALLGTRSRLWDAVEGWHEQAPTLFAAQRVTAVQFETDGPIDDLGVRLRPAASALVTRDLAPLRDRVVDLAALDGPTSRALASAARAFVSGRPEPLWRLLSRLGAAHSIDTKVEAAVARIETSEGTIRIDSLARSSGLSVRTLQNRFLAHVGLAPKEFARLLRLQAMLRALGGDSSLAELANDAGFSDQAHATREIKRVTGLTLARLRDELRRDRDGSTAIEIAAAFVRGGGRRNRTTPPRVGSSRGIARRAR